MRKLIFAVMVLLMAALPFASAAVLNERVHINRIRLGDYGVVSGGSMESYVYIYNDDPEERVRDGRVSIRFMDGGAYDSEGDIRIRSQQGRGVSFWTDMYGVEEGEHLVKITFTAADGVRKTRYRYVIVE